MKNRKSIVLLPGMDGTGTLFKPLLNQLTDHKCQVIALPKSGPQDYVTLTNHVKNALPDGEFILLAESFSGPIAVQLAQMKMAHLKGIIFVATFISPPRKWLINVARNLPIKWLNRLPAAQFIQKLLFFDTNVSPEMLSLFNEIIQSIPSIVLSSRLKSIATLDTLRFNCLLPTLYISATQDKLVSTSKLKEFQCCFENLSIQSIQGPHFIAQSKPKECGQVIMNFIRNPQQDKPLSDF